MKHKDFIEIHDYSAAEVMQIQDRILKGFPEVASVFGKAGRANSATDPAPVEMFETVINLKPQSEWRPGMTKNDIIAELDSKLQIPGVRKLVEVTHHAPRAFLAVLRQARDRPLLVVVLAQDPHAFAALDGLGHLGLDRIGQVLELLGEPTGVLAAGRVESIDDLPHLIDGRGLSDQLAVMPGTNL